MPESMEGIYKRLQKLYGEEAKQALHEIEKLIEKYRQKIVSLPYALTQKDMILITYGDQVVRVDEEPLFTLKHFLDVHIKDVINSVHILPFYPYSSDDGFSVIDYKDVSPRMGSWENIETMAADYRLMFDGVINHISQYSYWFRSFLAGDSKYKDFFIDMDPATDLSKVVRPRTLPLLHEYKDEEGKIHYIWTTFSKDQVDLNYKNYKVLLAVLDALFFYIEKGAKIIRLDAIAFVWKEVGTNCIHLPQTHELIQLMREVLHQVSPELMLVTETNVPHDENISYFGNGENEAQMVYNFALPPLLAHTMLKEDTTALTKWAKTLSLPSDKVCFFNFTASHDGCGLRPVSTLLKQKEIDDLVKTVEKRGGYVSYRATENGGKTPYELNASYIDIISDPAEEKQIRAKKMILTQAVMLAMPGVPGIYFHSLTGSVSDFNAVKRTAQYRSINREKLNYDILAQELETPGNLRAMIFRSYKKLLSIRKSEEVFHPYVPFSFPDFGKEIFAIWRHCTKSGEKLLALNNFSHKVISCDISNFVTYPAEELIANQRVENGTIVLEPYEVKWIKYREEKNENK
jgi:sucrose phosphorylase